MKEKTEKTSTTREPGFWRGFWHGLLAPLKLFLKFFKPDTVIFDTKNKCAKYKAGLFLGLVLAITNGHKSSDIKINKEKNSTDTE